MSTREYRRRSVHTHIEQYTYNTHILDTNTTEQTYIRIDIVELQIFQGGPQVALDMLAPVVGVPKLRLDKQVFALANTTVDAVLDGLAYFLFVACSG